MSNPSGLDPDAVPPGPRRFLVGAFCVAWLAVQVVVPFANQFELPSLRFRPISTFAWSMYSFPTLVYEVRLYIRAEDGSEETIPDVGRYVAGLSSPAPVPRRDPNSTAEEVQARYARLISFIARDRRDGRLYTASIRWVRHFRTDLPDHWEFTTRGDD
jgi:hypothetical protein